MWWDGGLVMKDVEPSGISWHIFKNTFQSYASKKGTDFELLTNLNPNHLQSIDTNKMDTHTSVIIVNDEDILYQPPYLLIN